MWDLVLCSTPELTCSIAYPQEEEVTRICNDAGFVNKVALSPAYLCENNSATSDFL